MSLDFMAPILVTKSSLWPVYRVGLPWWVRWLPRSQHRLRWKCQQLLRWKRRRFRRRCPWYCSWWENWCSQKLRWWGFTRFQPVSICKHGEFKGFHKIIGILIGIIEFDAGIITMGCDPSRKKLSYANKGLEWLGQYANTRPQKGSAAGSMNPFPEKSDAFCNIPWHRLENLTLTLHVEGASVSA